MTTNPEHNGTNGESREPRSISSIILENEILLMKLNAEFGARVFIGEGDIQPEIENHFLKSVYAFEQKAAQLHDREIIYHRIGSPGYRKAEELSDLEVPDELDTLNNKLYDHRIVLDTIAQYDPRLIYRFITEEFLHMEIDVWDAGDSMLHFCYEDFYPNHDFDLRQASRYFTNYIMDQQELLPQCGLYNRVRNIAGRLIGYKEVLEVIHASCSEFTERNLLSFSVTQVNILEDIGFVDFAVAYEAVMRNGEKIRISGNASIEFVYADDVWAISFLQFPGIVL